jgi:hypothetical protein
MHAFLAANPGKNFRDQDLRPFTVTELDAAIGQIFAATELSQGEPLATALAGQHREIWWGATPAPLGAVLAAAAASGREAEVFLHRASSAGTEAPGPQAVRISAGVARHAGGRRQGYRQLIGPPYWYFMTVGREGGRTIATRVVAFPVASLTAPYAVESEFERDFLVQRHAEGVALLKPAVHYHWRELGEEFWPFGLLPTGKLPHRPDLVAYRKGRCWLVELAGLDGDPVYLAEVERRLAAMVRVGAHPDLRPHRVLRREFLAQRAAARCG